MLAQMSVPTDVRILASIEALHWTSPEFGRTFHPILGSMHLRVSADCKLPRVDGVLREWSQNRLITDKATIEWSTTLWISCIMLRNSHDRDLGQTNCPKGSVGAWPWKPSWSASPTFTVIKDMIGRCINSQRSAACRAFHDRVCCLF